jgi:hypothetical protein
MRRTRAAPAGVPVSRAPIAPAAAPAPEPAAQPAPRPIVRKEEPSAVTRFTARDYGYVRRELQRIVVIATLIVVLIVVLSFFLP